MLPTPCSLLCKQLEPVSGAASLVQWGGEREETVLHVSSWLPVHLFAGVLFLHIFFACRYVFVRGVFRELKGFPPLWHRDGCRRQWVVSLRRRGARITHQETPGRFREKCVQLSGLGRLYWVPGRNEWLPWRRRVMQGYKSLPQACWWIPGSGRAEGVVEVKEQREHVCRV